MITSGPEDGSMVMTFGGRRPSKTTRESINLRSKFNQCGGQNIRLKQMPALYSLPSEVELDQSSVAA